MGCHVIVPLLLFKKTKHQSPPNRSPRWTAEKRDRESLEMGGRGVADNKTSSSKPMIQVMFYVPFLLDIIWTIQGNSDSIILYIYISIWVNYNISLPWIVRTFGDDSSYIYIYTYPIWSHIYTLNWRCNVDQEDHDNIETVFQGLYRLVIQQFAI